MKLTLVMPLYLEDDQATGVFQLDFAGFEKQSLTSKIDTIKTKSTNALQSCNVKANSRQTGMHVLQISISHSEWKN